MQGCGQLSLTIEVSRPAPTISQTEREIEKRERLLMDYQSEVSILEQEIKRLTAIVQAPSTPSLKDEIVTLRASLTRAQCSVKDMRASARETHEVWELVETALRQENFTLKEEIGKTKQELSRAKNELDGKRFLPFVNRFIQGRGRVVEEVSAPEVPPPTAQAERMKHLYM
jgi:predicted RNase H-like nuclease (RuvC/YqgF family)